MLMVLLSMYQQYTSYLQYNFDRIMIALFLLFVAYASAIDQGWIFNRALSLPPRLTVLQPASQGKLLVSSDQSLNLTSFTDPTSIEKILTNCFDQQLQFTYSNTGNEVIFIDEDHLYFVSLSPPSITTSHSTLQHNNHHQNDEDSTVSVTPAQIIRVTTPVAVGQEYKTFAFGGFSPQKQLVEVWTNNPKKFLRSLEVPTDLTIDRVYLIQDQLRIYFISGENLYALLEENITKIRQDVRSCWLHQGGELLCKLCTGEIALLSYNSSIIINTPTAIENQRYTSMAVSLDGQLLVEYGNDQNFIVSTLADKTLQTREQLSSTQTHISKVAISSDGQGILTYNCVDDSVILWQFGACESDKEIMEGFCKCRGNLLDFGGSCGCNDGQFADGGDTCQKCNFFCSSCEGTGNSCTEINVGGVLMVITIALAAVLLGLLVWRWRQKKRARKVELTAELLESISSER